MSWQLPDGIDRMAVNAALTTLTERWDPDAVRLVMQAFASLPTILPSQTLTRLRLTRGSSNIRGLTPEHGMVNIEDRKRDVVERLQGPPAWAEAAIGSFTVNHVHSPGQRISMITFKPFQNDPLVILGMHQEQPKFVLTFERDHRIGLGLYRCDFVSTVPSLWLWLRVTLSAFLSHPGRKSRITFTEAVITPIHFISEDELMAAIKSDTTP